MIKVLVVDDHEIVREGLVAALTADGRFDVVGAAGGADAATTLAGELRPDIAVIDFRLPDVPGDELCRRLRDEHPEMPVVMLSSYLSEEVVRRALAAGAAGYVTKAAGVEQLKSTLVEVAERGEAATRGLDPVQITRQLHALVAAREGVDVLTPQQERVLELASSGLTNRQIGARMHISESTVRFHIQKLKDQVGAQNRTELVARAIRHGLIEPAPADDAPRA